MKHVVGVFLLLGMLAGCASQPVLETVTDEISQGAVAQPKQILVDIPGEAALPAMDSNVGRMYLCEDYEIYIQTLSSGDIQGTIQSISGYPAEELTVMQTQKDGIRRYEFVWACAGETGDRLGRGVVLDDGSYHYVLTCMMDASRTQSLQPVVDELFDSFRLVSAEIDLNTGS